MELFYRYQHLPAAVRIFFSFDKILYVRIIPIRKVTLRNPFTGIQFIPGQRGNFYRLNRQVVASRAVLKPDTDFTLWRQSKQ
ncbi:hypothetical protein M2416_002112 [Raoultella sp. BIGb0132]|nr:hypothetical protein [Raoultella sp. BIGb0132]MCS4288049.1 hypothetical protein [Raoultella terrigena]